MSETKHYKGKLIPLDIIDNVEHTAQLILRGENIAPDTESYEHYTDQLYDMLGYDYLTTNDMIYQVQREECDPYDDIINATKNDDGSIDFEVKYSNGGCCFSEALEEAVGKMENK